MPRSTSICLLLAVLATAGCGGGTLTKEELQKQAEAVQSVAAEGALVAQGVQEGRTTGTFVRVHTEYLAEAATKVESDLESKPAGGSLDEKRGEVAELAAQVSNDLDELHRSPNDPEVAARVRSRLAKQAAAAEELAK